MMMTVHSQPSTSRGKPSPLRHRLMASGATVACATALLMMSATAQAQSTLPNGAYEGTPDVVVPGSAIIDRGFNQDNITINGTQAIINWTPYDRGNSGPIDFLPNGRFVYYSGLTNFTVLNRIIPLNGQDIPVARLIELNGFIQSFVGNAASQSFGPGGSVWFYSPGGILVGNSGVINVGNLVLSSRDIDTTGGLFGSNGEIRFRNPNVAGSDSAGITIAPGASIFTAQAITGSSYVAVVAPRIVQQGRINTDGSVALVAAEAADIRINQGLFDINVTVGTGDSNGIIHSGTTGGPTETSPDYASRVYMVAVPKNQAMTMLLSGTMGFETASSASIDANGAIVLSAGRNIANGALSSEAPSGTDATASFTINGGRFINALSGGATHDIRVAGTSDGTIHFERDLTLEGGRSVSLTADGARNINVTGDLLALSSTGNRGGSIAISAINGGSLGVGGALIADASGFGADGTGDASAFGGSVNLSVQSSGNINAGSIDLIANASGGVDSTGAGGNATAGQVRVLLLNGGSLSSSGLTATAEGFGGGARTAATGGNGIGGNASITVDSATLSLASVSASAGGIGGLGRGLSGFGSGGFATLEARNGGAVSVDFMRLSADGFGASGSQDRGDLTQMGGSGNGGTVTLNLLGGIDGHRITDLLLSANGRGGNGAGSSTGQPVRGGGAYGGTATLNIQQTTLNSGFVSLETNARGGNSDSSSGYGGFAQGGTSQITISGDVPSGLIASDQLIVSADATAGTGDLLSGNGTGGQAFVTVGASGTIDTANLTLSASAPGSGQPTAGGGGGAGGGAGGTARLITSGTVNAGLLTVRADGSGGLNGAGVGGDGVGGTADLIIEGGSVTSNGVVISANGVGGRSVSSDGQTGRGVGGGATLKMTGGSTLTVTGDVAVSAFATVDDVAGGTSAGAQGGTVILDIGDDSRLSATGLVHLEASAETSNFDEPVFASRDSIGGDVTLNVSAGGYFEASRLRATANGTASHAVGAGGSGFGGTITFNAVGGTISATSLASTENAIFAQADGFGADGSTAGNGRGGEIRLFVDTGSMLAPGVVYLSASGTSGFSPDTFSTARTTATGGLIDITLTEGVGSTIDVGFLSAFADGFAPINVARTDAFGGSINLTNRGAFSADIVSLGASGTAGGNGVGTGGDIRALFAGGTTDVTYGSFSAYGSGATSDVNTDGSEGRGGTISLIFDGGTYTGQTLALDASGFGGNGGTGTRFANGSVAVGSGGRGVGGTIAVEINDGSIDLSDLILESSGVGGRGGNFNYMAGSSAVIGSGGSGEGGNVSVDVNGGNANGTLISLYAGGRGGNAGRLTNIPGTLTDTPTDRDIFALAGTGQGGTATVRLYSTVGGAYSIDTSATGGEGGSGFAGQTGGLAQGGLSQLIIEDIDAGLVNVELRSVGYGGRGGRGIQGAGGHGNTGTGGTARIIVNGPNGRLSLADNLIDVSGYGGNGADGYQFLSTGNGYEGGYGGDGRGGTIELVAQSGGRMTLAATGGEGVFEANGFGGTGGNGSNNDFGPEDVATFGGNAGFAGFGFGGNILLKADSGTVDSGVGAFLRFSAGGTGGDFAFGGAGTVVTTFDPVTGDPIVSGGNGYNTSGASSHGGFIRMLAQGNGINPGLITLGETSIDVSGTFAGRIMLEDRATGAGLAFSSLTALANGYIQTSTPDLLTGGSGIVIYSQDGAMRVTRSATFTTSRELGGSAAPMLIHAANLPGLAPGGLLVGGTFTFTGGAISGVHAGNPGIDQSNATIDAAQILITSSAGINFAESTLLLGGSQILLDAGIPGFESRVQFGGLRSSGGINIVGSSIGGVQARASGLFDARSTQDTSINLVSASSININAGTTLFVDSFLSTSGGTLFLAGGDLTINKGNAAGLLTGTSSGGAIRLGTLSSGGNATFNAATTMTIASLSTLLSSASSGSIDLTSGGQLQLGQLNSQSGIRIRSSSVAGATSVLEARSLIDIVTSGALDIGSANGSTITFTSGGPMQFGDIFSGGTVLLNSSTAIIGGSLVTLSGDATLVVTGGDVSLGSADIGGAFTVNASRDVSINRFVSDFDADISAGRNATVAQGQTEGSPGNTFTSAPGVPVNQAGGATTSNIALNVGGTLALGSLNSLSNITIRAATLTGATSSLRASGQIDVATTGAATFGTLDAQSALISAGGNLLFTRSTTAGSTSINALGVTGGQLVSTAAGLTVTAGSGGIRIDTVQAETGALLSSSGLINIGTLSVSDGDALIDSDGDVTLGTATVNYLLDVQAGGNATLGTIRAGTIQALAGSAITATDLTSTGAVQSTQGLTGQPGDIRLRAGTAVNLGFLNSATGIRIDAATLTGATSGLTAVGGVAITTSGAATLGSIDAASSTLTTGALTFNRITTSGNTDINAAGTVTGATLASTGGALSVTTTAGGNVTLATVNGTRGVTIIGAGSADINSLTTSGGNALIDMIGNVSVNSANIAGNFDIDSDGNAAIGTSTSAGATRVRAGGTINATSITTTGNSANSTPALIRLAAGGAVTLGSLNSANAIDIAGASLNGATSTLRAATSVDINSRGAATFGSIDAASALITASDAISFDRLTTSNNASLSAGGAVTGRLLETTASGSVINATGLTVSLDTVRAAGDARLSATGGALTVTSLGSAGQVSANGRTVTIGGSSNLDFSALNALAGDARVTLASGALRVRSANVSGALNLTTSSGSMIVDSANAGSINIDTRTSLSLLGPATATGDMIIRAGGNVGINGATVGRIIRITSGNISIGSSGRLGSGGTTTLVDLTNGDGGSRTFIGGDDTTSGYSLSATELLRIFADNIAIHAPRAQAQGGESLGSNRPPDVVIGAFTVNGGAASTGNLGASGTFSIDTPGTARVIGAVQFNGMTASNRFSLSARAAIEVILGQGSIRLANGSSRAGILSLDSDDIVVATASAITDIAAATTIDAIDARLARNDGITNDEGALSAAELRLSVQQGLYIQNSGTGENFADRRGFTADRVFISTESGTNRIVINGRIADDTGLLRSGLDAIELITINGSAANSHTANGGGFDPGSTINGCVIVQAASCSVGFQLPPIQDVVDDVIDDEDETVTGSGDGLQAQVLINIRDVEALPNEPLVDDPVTGTGNDDLWTAPTP